MHSGKDSQEQIHLPAAYVLLLRATYVSQLMARIRDERCIYGRWRGRRDRGPVLHISRSATRIVISNENQLLLTGWTDKKDVALLEYFVRAPFSSFTQLNMFWGLKFFCCFFLLNLEFYCQVIYGWNDSPAAAGCLCSLNALSNGSDVFYLLSDGTIFRMNYFKL